MARWCIYRGCYRGCSVPLPSMACIYRGRTTPRAVVFAPSSGGFCGGKPHERHAALSRKVGVGCDACLSPAQDVFSFMSPWTCVAALVSLPYLTFARPYHDFCEIRVITTIATLRINSCRRFRDSAPPSLLLFLFERGTFSRCDLTVSPLEPRVR